MTKFTDLGLAEPLLKALAAEGYETPTPIQAQAIPAIRDGRDLLGAAQTGTGKTAAFSLPMLHRLLGQPRRVQPRSVRALILSPTRELAAQIEANIRGYAQFTSIKSTVIFGGVPVGKQIRALAQQVDILVATPGRLLDLVDQRAVSLREIEFLVLDEADQMLDLGFIHALRRIATLIPQKRQTLLFSATMPKAIREIASAYLTDPVEVAVTPVATTAEKIDQRVIFTEAGQKPALLAKTLSVPEMERAIVFTRTKHGADKVVRQLEQSNIKAAAIHGNKSQGQRERALGAFRDGELRILVATDIAARGIDVDGISHVVNFDLPNVPETYVHRIGRTARAGASGVAIAFCTPEERGDLAGIEKLTKVALTPIGEVPYWDGRTPKKPPQNQGRGGRGQQGGGGRDNGRGEGQRQHQGQRQGAKPGNGGGHNGSGRNGGGQRSDAPRPNQARNERPAQRNDAPAVRKEAASANEGLGGVAFLQQRTEQRRTNGARRRAN
ncbi:DEAD/DEAH box helicase [Bosea sp. (in: a-proteobacteria)]|uniref:DEAD/DEAH box helicase n=1 Tax=Bosea sp. (in: a-proteobacteria) TaxID=1871050 RepID=UPI00086BC924|nr:DEAD/DEAH box helicase [Bosea sp. (in: a-proteobacteria)]MBN9438936.1 DEAD/DEAH box helicase [Bosea sp. (in: a-proteobacteria)]ODT55717.1 MAG: RNA helicase [Methylobacterium sp. SCN 67-24]